jgi:hypothetical protein
MESQNLQIEDNIQRLNLSNKDTELENALYNFFRKVAEKDFTELGYDLSFITEEQYQTKIEELKISFFNYFTKNGN